MFKITFWLLLEIINERTSLYLPQNMVNSSNQWQIKIVQTYAQMGYSNWVKQSAPLPSPLH